MEFAEPLSDCRMLANRIGRENLKRTAGIEPSVRERCTASAPEAPANGQEPGGEHPPPRPANAPAPGSHQPAEAQADAPEAEGAPAATGLSSPGGPAKSGPGRGRS